MTGPKLTLFQGDLPRQAVVIPPASSTPSPLVTLWKGTWEKVWSPLTNRALERVSTPARFARPHILHYQRLNTHGEGENANPLGALALWLIPDPTEKLPRDLTPEGVVPVMVLWEAILHLVMAQLQMRPITLLPAALLTLREVGLTGKWGESVVSGFSPLVWFDWHSDGLPAEVITSRLLHLACHHLEMVTGGERPPPRHRQWMVEVSLLHPAVSMMVARVFPPRRRTPDPTFWVDHLTRAVVEDVGGADRVVVESRLTTVAHRRELEQQLRTWLGV